MNCFLKYNRFMNILTLRRERVGRNLIHAMLRIIFNTCVLRIKRKIKFCFFNFLAPGLR